MNFGPAEMAQTMDAAKALITVMLVSSVSIGIVLGAIVVLSRHRAADQSFQSGMPTAPALLTATEEIERATAPRSDADARQKLVNAAREIRAEYEVAGDDEELLRLAGRQITAADLTWLSKLLAQWEWDLQHPSAETVLAQEIDATASHSPRSPVPRANKLIRLVDLIGIVVLIAIAGGGFFSYYTSKRSDFESRPDISQRSDASKSSHTPQRPPYTEIYSMLGIPSLPEEVAANILHPAADPLDEDAPTVAS